MSMPSRTAYYSRGASVLAALVLAAIMASVALLVQEGSPVAYKTDTAAFTADAAAPAAPAGQSAQNNNCNPQIDHQITVTSSDGSGKMDDTPFDVCTESNKRQTFGATAGTGDVATWNQGVACDPTTKKPTDPKRISLTKVCVAVPGQGNSQSCRVQKCEPGKPVMQGVASTLGKVASDAGAQGVIKQDNANSGLNAIKNAIPTSDQGIFDQAYGVQQQLAQARAEKAQAEGQALEAGEYLKNMADVDPGAFKQCQSSSNLGTACQDYNDANAKLQAANDTLRKADDRIKNLTDMQSKLDASGGPPKTDDTKTPPDKTPGGQTPPGQQPPGSRTPGNGNPTGFGGNNGSGGGGNPMGGQQPQQQRPAQQSPSQQQCQPQYQCTTNGSISTATGAMPISVVMYNQCPQQGAQWQQYQQCPQGYSCQNNGCVAVAPYGYCSDGRTPRTGPAQQQPPASSCTVGTWTDASNGCQTNWQCTNGSGSNGTLTAQLSCQPLTAASGTTITFSYACAGGATTASSTGFTLSSATTLSGTASTVLQKPASGSTVTYALACTNASVTPNTTAGAQCAVQVGKSSIVLVATPEKISKSETDDAKKKSTIGWVTSGMQSCVISDQDFPDWTNQQASNKSVSGAVPSPNITADTTFKLTCQTLGGTEASSTVKVLSI